MWMLLVLLIASPAIACPKGYTEWEGTCSADLQPEAAEPAVPSDEKPSRHPEPAWQRGDVGVLMPQSLQMQDEKEDRERNDAEIVGKKAAGIK